MVEAIYDKINDYGSVTIKLASPEDIRSWSFGEVKKAETINYRTYRPEMDGLFCERIFGPQNDWECPCGKYKGIKHKGIICDRCGVKVTHSRVRRKRMGHINLAAPVAHIWFFKSLPSRLGNLLAIKTSSLERVIYYVDYIVIDPGNTPLKHNQLLTQDEYDNHRATYGNEFEAGMGAEAVKKLLQRLDLESLANQLREELKATRSKQKQKELASRLKTVEMLRESDNRPEWMTLDVVPVIPPELRPLVLLESGNFASSDLNDLYRRLINRNNRLKKLLELNAPEVIIRNEKRMLQQSVDALFDNARCKRSVVGTAKRPLKSLTDLIKGKQGRFRENLLGKRVDYSARSVIVVGPELKLNQCGVPKKIALELFQPFIIRKLKEIAAADTIKSAKKMLDRRDEQVWDILDEVIHEHPVLLNRAPTLHRMGIQAFEPVLVEGNALRIHPLVCSGFNADFDGDQMAVHLPLSVEAQVEASTLMLSVNNIFSPASGKPVIAPSQDIVLGVYYLTVQRPGEKGEGMRFGSMQEVFLAYATGKIGTHSKVYVRVDADFEVVDATGRPQSLGWLVPDEKGKSLVFERHDDSEDEDGVKKEIDASRPAPVFLETTVGRVILNDILPEGMPFFNATIHKKANTVIIEECHRRCGRHATLHYLDALKSLGFKASTRAGVSFSKNDLRIPDEKEQILEETQKAVEDVKSKFNKGLIAKDERTNQIIALWMAARDELGQMMMTQLASDTRDGKPYLNPVYIMADSGARGSVDQIRQLAGMRGLMAKPSGDIIETPIKANFREGLRVLEYFSSTHGARKGLADTALKTADSGYLTRKLADVAQNVVINEHDCGTISGLTKRAVRRGAEVEVSLSQQIYGRTACDKIVNDATGEVVVSEGEVITRRAAAQIEDIGVDGVRVRSPLTCETPLGICAKCYGADLSTGLLVEEGMAVGIIAAQSIGEPGTQLTMRTFHIGGVAESSQENERFFAPASVSKQAQKGLTGKVTFENIDYIARSEVGDFDRAAFLGTSEIKKQTKAQRAKDKIVLSRNAVLVIDYETKVKGKMVPMQERVDIPLGSLLKIDEGETIKYGAKLAEWDPHNDPVLATAHGNVRYEDVVENQTMKIEDGRKVIIPHKGDKHPQIQVIRLEREELNDDAKIYHRKDGDIKRGVLLAEQPRAGAEPAEGDEPVIEEVLFAPKGLKKEQKEGLKGVLRLVDIESKRLQVVDLKDFLDLNEDLGGKYLGFTPSRAGSKKVLLTSFEAEIAYTPGKTEKVETLEIPRGAVLAVDHEGKVAIDKVVYTHEPAVDRILAAQDGTLEFQNFKPARDGSVDKQSKGQAALLITVLLAYEPLVENAHITVDDGEEVARGQLIAKVPTEMAKTQDITGGLPRVTEIFEARKPKNPSVLAELDGIVKLGKMRRNKQVIKIVSETGKIEMEHLVPQGKKVLVNAEQRVAAGDRLVDGPPVPHDILRISGVDELQEYLINEVQSVYRSQNVRIDDKHIEIIVSQMLRKVQVIDPGDTDFLPDEVVDKFKLQAVNRRYIDRGQKGARNKPLLLGITKASLQSESFISAASFQETTKVLTAAALQGKKDMLLGLKENVILGHMIPAGTGFKAYLNGSVKKELAAYDMSARIEEKGLLERPE